MYILQRVFVLTVNVYGMCVCVCVRYVCVSVPVSVSVSVESVKHMYSV